MSSSEEQNTTHSPRHALAKVLLFFVVFLAILQAVLWYWASPVLRRATQWSVRKLTDSLYSADFQKIQVNLLSGKIYIKDFMLIPDSSRQAGKNLYTVKFENFAFGRLNFIQLVRANTLSIDLVSLQKPQLSIVADKIKADTTLTDSLPLSYTMVKNDFLSLFLNAIDKLEIKKIEILDGKFDFLKQELGQTFNADNITLIINNFEISQETIDRKSLFAEDFEIIIKNYSLDLGKIYKLSSSKLYVSSKEKLLILDSIKLEPCVSLKDTNINLIDFHADKIKLTHADFEDIYLNNRLDIDQAVILRGKLKIIGNRKKQEGHKTTTPLSIYKIVKSKNIDFIKVNVLALKQTAFVQLDTLNNKLISTAESDIKIMDFLIDSTALNSQKRIFFAKGFYFDINKLRLLPTSATHYTYIEKFYFDSRKKEGYINKLSYRPIPSQRGFDSLVTKSNAVNIGFLHLNGFDIFKAYYEQKYIFDQIAVDDAQIQLTQHTQTKKKRGKPVAQNWLFYSNNLVISNSALSLTTIANNSAKSIETNIELTANRLEYNPSQKEPLNSGAIIASFTDMALNATDETHKLRIEQIYISSTDSSATIKNLIISPKQNIMSLLKEKNQNLAYSIKVPLLTISKTNLLEAFEKKQYDIHKFDIENAEIAITSFPDILNKQQKSELNNKVRDKAAAKLLFITAKSGTKIYQKINFFSPYIYQLLKYKETAIDTVYKTAFDAVYEVHIPLKSISPKDTTSKITDRIISTVQNFCAIVENKDLSLEQIDSLKNYTLYQLQQIKEENQKPDFDIRQISKSIAKLTDKLTIDSLYINNTRLKLYKHSDSLSNLVFDNYLTIELYKVNIDKNQPEKCTRKLLCAEELTLKIKNYTFFLQDNSHKISLENFKFSTSDSSIYMQNISIVADTTCKSRNLFVNSNIPDLKIHHIDYWSYIDFQKILISKISTQNTVLNIIDKTTQSSKKTNRGANQIVLPAKFLKQIKIDTIELQGYAQLNKGDTAKAQTFYDLFTTNITLDSITELKKNKFLIPVEKFSIKLWKTSLTSQNFNLTIDTTALDSKINLTLNQIKANLPDSQFIHLKTVKIINIDTNILLNKQFIAHELIVDSLRFALKSKKSSSEPKTKFSLDSVDLYKITQPFFDKISLNTIALTNIYHPINNLKYNQININAVNFTIDSTTKIRSPKLFYADNWIVKIDSIKTKAGPLYNFTADKIVTDLQNAKITSQNIELFPSIPTEEILDTLTWRTTIIRLSIKELGINKINWLLLIDSNKFKAKNIVIDQLVFDGYTDKKFPHKPVRKPHYVEMLAKLRWPVDIAYMQISNSTIIYREKLPDASVAGEISLDKLNAIIKNINNTNLTNKYVTVELTSQLVNTGKLYVYGSFKMDTLHYPFKIYGTLKDYDLTKLNGFTANAANFIINSGYLYSGKFYMDGFDTVASGIMNLHYDNLSVSLLKDTKDKKKKRLKFLSFVADVIVRSENPKYGIFNRIGTIAYIHDPTYSDVKFWIKGIISGITSVVVKDNKRDIKQINEIRQYYQKEILGNSSLLKSINSNKLKKKEKNITPATRSSIASKIKLMNKRIRK